MKQHETLETGGVLPVGLAFALLVRRLSFRPAHDLRGVLGPHLGEPPEGRLPLAEAQKRQGRGLGAQKRFADRFHGLPRLRLPLHSCHAPWNAVGNALDAGANITHERS